MTDINDIELGQYYMTNNHRVVKIVGLSSEDNCVVASIANSFDDNWHHERIDINRIEDKIDTSFIEDVARITKQDDRNVIIMKGKSTRILYVYDPSENENKKYAFVALASKVIYSFSIDNLVNECHGDFPLNIIKEER